MADEARHLRQSLTSGTVSRRRSRPRLPDRRRRAGDADGDARTAHAELHRGGDRSRRTTARCGRRSPRRYARRPPTNGDETGLYQRNATAAPGTATSCRAPPTARADALHVMALGLDRRDYFRPALAAYEASLALVNSAEVKAEYDDLKARKGFRVVEHTIDSDNSAPRVCAQFSEDLVKSGVDYSQFVTVDDAAPKAVDAGGRQICVEGPGAWRQLQHHLPPGPARGDRRGPGSAGAAQHLHPGPRAVGPLHRRQLRAAGDRAPRHSGRHRQSRRGRHEAVPHRRPFAGAASVRLPVPAPARRLRHQLDRRPDGRAGLGGQARDRQRPQQGSDDQLPDRRGAAGPQARRLRAHRAAGERQAATTGSRAPRSGSWSPTSGSPPTPARTG